MTSTPTFRSAEEEHDEELAVILTNSFLPLWNHNWFHGISHPLDRLPQQQSLSSPSVPLADLSRLQIQRRSFYRFLIKLTRGIGGEILIATIPSPDDVKADLVAAILLWCPPHRRNASSFGLQFMKDLFTLYKAGIISVVRNYGLGGFSRVTDVFEDNVQRMFKESLTPRGFIAEECGFVQMTAVNTDPRFDHQIKGKGFARQLLQWRIEKHWIECKDPKAGTSGKVTPVILDTTTIQGITAYERIGFELVNQYVPDTGTDANGYKLSKKLSKEAKEKAAAEARDNCIMRIMIQMPPSATSP